MNHVQFETRAEKDGEPDEKTPRRVPEGDEPDSGKGAGRKGNYQHKPEDQRGKPDPKETERPIPPKGR